VRTQEASRGGGGFLSELRIADELSLPKQAATWVISYVAKRGAGKTYDASVQAEEMLKRGVPIVVVDGMGIWWGLRVKADGEGAGFPIVVFGGEHADLPLVPERAAEIAKAIVETNISCVLDVSPFSKYVARKIVMLFLNELYRLNRVERHVYVEEADLWAPQRPIGQEEALCLSAVDNFVRRGGNHNLGCTLITQRSAVLNKDILTQSDCLVILRTLAPQDKKAIQAWVEEQTDEDRTKLNQWYDSLKTLENGEAWVWHPEKPAIFKKVKFRLRETFHATREFIRSPQAAKIILMDVEEFVSKFRSVFDLKSGSASVNAPVEPSVNKAELEALRIEVEEFRSGRKLADSVQQRLKFLGEVKADLEKRLNAADKTLEAYTNLQYALRTAINVQNIYDNIHRVEEKIPTAIPTAIPTESKQVGLQATATIVDMPATEKLVTTINTESMRGKILTVAKKGKLATWRKLGEIVSEIQEEKWSAESAEVNNALNDLEKDGLIAKKHTDRNYFCLAQGVKFKEASG
jgi:hypothetical protein